MLWMSPAATNPELDPDGAAPLAEALEPVDVGDGDGLDDLVHAVTPASSTAPHASTPRRALCRRSIEHPMTSTM